MMEESEYTVVDFVAKGKNHAYLIGDQHLPGKQGEHFILPFATHIYVMQVFFSLSLFFFFLFSFSPNFLE